MECNRDFYVEYTIKCDDAELDRLIRGLDYYMEKLKNEDGSKQPDYWRVEEMRKQLHAAEFIDGR